MAPAEARAFGSRLWHPLVAGHFLVAGGCADHPSRADHFFASAFIYDALTHGANFPLDIETPPAAHGVRLAFQSVLLAMFWEMAQTTVIDFKVNMGLMTAAEAARAAVPM